MKIKDGDLNLPLDQPDPTGNGVKSDFFGQIHLKDFTMLFNTIK